MNENRRTALRYAVEIWSVYAEHDGPAPPIDVLRIADELEHWLTRPEDHLVLTASTPRPIA